MSKRILSISRDRSILQTRHFMFEPLGYEVVSALDLRMVEDFCASQWFDLVLIDHSIGAHEKRRVAGVIATLAPECPIIEMCVVSPEIRDAEAHVLLDDGPEALIRTVNELMQVCRTRSKSRPYSMAAAS